MKYRIKTIHMKRFGFFLAEAWNDKGQYLAFAQGETQQESEEKLQDKMEKHYHLNKKNLIT